MNQVAADEGPLICCPVCQGGVMAADTEFLVPMRAVVPMRAEFWKSALLPGMERIRCPLELGKKEVIFDKIGQAEVGG